MHTCEPSHNWGGPTGPHIVEDQLIYGGHGWEERLRQVHSLVDAGGREAAHRAGDREDSLGIKDS